MFHRDAVLFDSTMVEQILVHYPIGSAEWLRKARLIANSLNGSSLEKKHIMTGCSVQGNEDDKKMLIHRMKPAD